MGTIRNFLTKIKHNRSKKNTQTHKVLYMKGDNSVGRHVPGPNTNAHKQFDIWQYLEDETFKQEGDLEKNAESHDPADQLDSELPVSDEDEIFMSISQKKSEKLMKLDQQRSDQISSPEPTASFTAASKKQEEDKSEDEISKILKELASITAGNSPAATKPNESAGKGKQPEQDDKKTSQQPNRGAKQQAIEQISKQEEEKAPRSYDKRQGHQNGENRLTKPEMQSPQQLTENPLQKAEMRTAVSLADKPLPKAAKKTHQPEEGKLKPKVEEQTPQAKDKNPLPKAENKASQPEDGKPKPKSEEQSPQAKDTTALDMNVLPKTEKQTAQPEEVKSVLQVPKQPLQSKHHKFSLQLDKQRPLQKNKLLFAQFNKKSPGHKKGATFPQTQSPKDSNASPEPGKKNSTGPTAKTTAKADDKEMPNSVDPEKKVDLKQATKTASNATGQAKLENEKASQTAKVQLHERDKKHNLHPIPRHEIEDFLDIKSHPGYKSFERACRNALKDFIEIHDGIHGAMILTSSGLQIVESLKQVDVLDETFNQITALHKLSTLIDEALDLGKVSAIQLHGSNRVLFIFDGGRQPLLIAWLTQGIPFGMVLIEAQKTKTFLEERFQKLICEKQSARIGVKSDAATTN